MHEKQCEPETNAPICNSNELASLLQVASLYSVVGKPCKSHNLEAMIPKKLSANSDYLKLYKSKTSHLVAPKVLNYILRPL